MESVRTDGLKSAETTCFGGEQPAGLSVSQVSSRDRRTIVDTWIECVAAHHCLHVTFSECHKKTTFFEQPKRSVVNFKKYCGQSRGWFVSSNLNSQDHNIAFLMVNDSH